MDFQGKKVGLLGAGIENIALIPHLRQAGAEITVCNRVVAPATDDLRDQDIKLVVGENYLNDLGRFDYVFRIAGMPVATLQEALDKLEKKPIVTSPTDLFLALKLCHIIGVTGTKGKGTTATMIGEIINAAGKKAAVVGNIGQPIFDIVEDLTPETYAVIELSSFQLEDVHHSPEIAVILPISQDHLQPLSASNPNFHPSFEQYAQSKANITAFQTTTDFLVYAADSKIVQDIANNSAARRLGVGEQTGDLRVLPTGEIDAGKNEVINFSELGLTGRHVYLDAALALAVARELGCDTAAIKEGLKNFRPLPHRLETVGTFDGVKYIDDSYATAPEAAIGAIEGLDQPVIWIGGGSRKGAEFEDLARTVAESTIKAVVLMGEEGPRLQAAIEKFNPDLPIFNSNSMPEAVAIARDHAKKGDTVLLSPACASKDMFENAADRGDQFQAAIKK